MAGSGPGTITAAEIAEAAGNVSIGGAKGTTAKVGLQKHLKNIKNFNKLNSNL